jgi:hypothetical protein
VLFAVGSQVERSKERSPETIARNVVPGESAAQHAREAGGETAPPAKRRQADAGGGENGHVSAARPEIRAETGTRTSEAQHRPSAESSAGETPTQLSNGARGAPGTSSESGTPESVAERAKETRREANLLGVNPEALSLVIIAVIVSVLLAVATWFRRPALVLCATAVFGLVFAALDVREVLHQIDESRTSLIVIASSLIGLHLLVATLASAALILARVRPGPASN